MTKRLVVFVDYQNIYRRARGVFHDHSTSPHWDGQVQPDALGNLIVRMSHDQQRVLHQVRMYRGMPDSTRDPKGYGAASRQIDAWRKLPLVNVTTRPFRYPPDYPQSKAQEKGIDVQLALDFVMMAVRGEYDVGVLMSNDTDLRPALEQANLLGTRTVEVAAWRPPLGRPSWLRLPGVRIWCHLIDQVGYDTIRDGTDYTQPLQQ
jgi:hypothetical protein